MRCNGPTEGSSVRPGRALTPGGWLPCEQDVAQVQPSHHLQRPTLGADSEEHLNAASLESFTP